MNEFEWRRPLRNLRQPIAPRHDLWTRIDAALEAIPVDSGSVHASAPPARRRQHWFAAGMAASVLLALGIGMQLTRPSAPSLVQITPEFTHWKPNDPRLAGAAIVLDAAHMELQQALRQAPDSAALQRLLGRTTQQQARLRRFDQRAG